MRTALLLIALGFGFKIFAEASSNAKKSVRRLGRVVGSIIMITSFLGTLCAITYTIKHEGGLCPTGKHWGMSGKMCPLTGKPLADMTAQSKGN